MYTSEIDIQVRVCVSIVPVCVFNIVGWNTSVHVKCLCLRTQSPEKEARERERERESGAFTRQLQQEPAKASLKST